MQINQTRSANDGGGDNVGLIPGPIFTNHSRAGPADRHVLTGKCVYIRYKNPHILTVQHLQLRKQDVDKHHHPNPITGETDK